MAQTRFTQAEFKAEMEAREKAEAQPPRYEYRVGSWGGQGHYVVASSASEALISAGFGPTDQGARDVIIWKVDGKLTRLAQAYRDLGHRDAIDASLNCPICGQKFAYYAQTSSHLEMDHGGA